jgi:hypothetical protein
MTCHGLFPSLSHPAVILGEEVHSGSTDRAKPGQERSPDGYGFPLVSSHLHIPRLFSLFFILSAHHSRFANFDQGLQLS